MSNVDLKALLGKLNSFCSTTLHSAASLCVSRTQYEVMLEHFFLKAMQDNRSDLPLIYRHFEINEVHLAKAFSEALEELKTGNAGKPVFSEHLIDVLQDAWTVTSIELGEDKIRSAAVMLAFLSKRNKFTGREFADILGGISRDALIRGFADIVRSSKEQRAITSAETPSLRRPGTPVPKVGAKSAGRSAADQASGKGFIKEYCVDFTARAREGLIDPIFGRDKEVREIVDILARRRKNNPILVGDPGVGKTAVIEGLALRIVEGDVPDMLLDVNLLALDMGALQAGAGMKGEFENRLKGVLAEIKSSEVPIILFIDEAHVLVGAGGPAGGSDASNLLKPVLARGEVRTCAATTWSEYKKYFEKDPALARRFQLVKLAEPDVETTALILRGLKDNYETAHNVIVRDDAIQAAAELSDRYISGRFLPDKAIDLLDTACARVKVNLSAKPASLEDKERTIQALEREQKAMDRDRTNHIDVDEERYGDIQTQMESTREKEKAIHEQWDKEKESVGVVAALREKLQELDEGETAKRDELRTQLRSSMDALIAMQEDDPLIHMEVSPDVVAKVVSDWTGIPAGKMLRDEADVILDLEDRLKERIKGQDEALVVMAEVIRAGKSGLKNPNTPLGVFLLVGPSGVGKTETGLALADLMFGGERNMVTINMSEFQESHTVSRLIGSPPGYIGYGEGGILTEAVRQNPYSVVLLDEVEKAHLDVMNLFYQVFDKGMLSDGEGKEINFKNTIMILTSNLGTDIIQEVTGQAEIPPLEDVLAAIRPILSKHFKPALLARMTIAPYFSLNDDAMKMIVELKLEHLRQTLLENNKMQLTWGPGVVKRIADRCTEVETGARNIEYILNGNILPQLSRTILSKMAEGAMPSGVNLELGADGAFVIDFTVNQGNCPFNPRPQARIKHLSMDFVH